MSLENIEALRGAYEAMNEAFARGEVPLALIQRADPEIVIDMGVLEGTFHGHEGFRRFIEGQLAIIDELRCEPLEIIDADDRMVVPVHLTGRARHTGLPFDYRVVHVWTLRDGRAVHMRMYASKGKALEALEMRE